jgi:FAD/FMN-containing dehydrogenase
MPTGIPAIVLDSSSGTRVTALTNPRPNGRSRTIGSRIAARRTAFTSRVIGCGFYRLKRIASLSQVIVNDVQSGLNETEVAELVAVSSLESLQTAVAGATRDRRALIAAGGRHSMGGQQFLTGGTLVDTRPMSSVVDFDSASGLVEVEAGIQWPTLIDSLIERQADANKQWGIRQKQTGADAFTLGGSVSANCHGRGLKLPPIAADVESLKLVHSDGTLVPCSRSDNAELFSLVLGGYGLFGAIYSVTLRLTRRRKLERVVELTAVDQLAGLFEARAEDGFLYGDFQFAVDPGSADFLRRGVFSCYRPVGDDVPVPAAQAALTAENWQLLLSLAHTDKSRAFDEYAHYYLSTSGQIYWSDLHQLSYYVGGYHEALDELSGAAVPASEVISELYVPRARLQDFMAAAAQSLRENRSDVIYGTIRVVERDEDSFLPWARDRYACVIFNLHTEHTEEGVRATAHAFRELIDLAVARGGSFFLTYHRWAERRQLAACYPQLATFLEKKREYDPGGVFQSDWYRHMTGVVEDA